MKFTEAELRQLLQRSPPQRLDDLTQKLGLSGAKRKRVPVIEAAHASLRDAHVESLWEPGQRFGAAFIGARLLSLNELLRLDLRVVNGYRKLWHRKALATLQLAMAGRVQSIDGPVRLTLCRHGTNLVDNDGLGASFKFAIDGFKEAGLIADDNPMVVQEILLEQRQGPYVAALLFESNQLPRSPLPLQQLLERALP